MTTQTPDAVREAVARIVDPGAWTDPAKSDAAYDRTPYRERSLAKADAILAILAALDSRAGDVGEGNPVSRCSIGSCKRHHRCMYMPCRAATPAPAVDAECQLCHGLNTSCPNGCEIIHDAVDAVPAGEVLKQQAHEWRRVEVQAIGAAISTRSWHAVEQAYNALRDKMDTAGCWHASAALSHGEADRG